MGKVKYRFAEWCRANGKEKLLNLYSDCNDQSAEEAAFSSAALRKWSCPVCGMTWLGETNKMNRLTPGYYNVIKKRPEETYCPYCKGSSVSPYYSMTTERPWTVKFWDEERNGKSAEALKNEPPNSHKKFFFKCKLCGYPFPKPICPRDIKEELQCPECGDGRSRETTERNCLATLFPQIAQELVDEANEGITGWNIRPSYHDRPLWFCCSRGHIYKSWVYNRTLRGDGCPICGKRKKTSFMEQSIFFYIKKMVRDVWSNQIYQGTSIDIFLQRKRIAVEYNSVHYHNKVRNKSEALEQSLAKYRLLSKYNKVFVVTEWEEEAKILEAEKSQLIIPIAVPIFIYSKKVFSVYNEKILELLKQMFPNRDSYPNIDIQRDELNILAQYIKAPVKRSFQEQYPNLAKDWDWDRNGTLMPNMFAASGDYKFYWICRKCGKSYRMSMTNRRKVNPETCPFCARSSRFPSPLLSECYPQLRFFWNNNLNTISFDDVSVASEKFAIFNLPNGEILSIKICNITYWLMNHPDRNPEEYLQHQLMRIEKRNQSPM